MSATHRDLVVIGGGPAGSTLATLVKKYHPGRRVLLAERAVFPRHHVGETLLPELVPILKELGAFEKIDGAGFPKKLGATYVWGRDRTPWDADFVDIQKFLLGAGSGTYAWQVRRSRYDQILLDHARESGVEVLEGWAAVGIREEKGRIAGVSLKGPNDEEMELSCDFVADCSGQGAFLSRFRPFRRHNEKLKNMAGYAYFRGAPWKFQYVGHPDKTRSFICNAANGTFWYIPIAADLVSVGFVTSQENYKKSGGDFRALFRDSLRACDELWSTLKDAEWVQDFDGTGQDFFVQNDWSYLNDYSAGEGWVAAGDAAVFVDPILSSGVTLAHLSAHRAAYMLGALWEEPDPAVRRALTDDYSSFYREAASAFLAMAVYWYDASANPEGWWALARKTVDLPYISDKDAFIMVAAGFASLYERVHTVRSLLLDGSAGNVPFLKNVLGGHPGMEAAARAPIPDAARPRLLYPVESRASFLPIAGTGRMKPVRMVCFQKTPAADPLLASLNPRRLLVGPQAAILDSIDGRRSVAELRAAAMAESGLGAGAAGDLVTRFLRDLIVAQVVELA